MSSYSANDIINNSVVDDLYINIMLTYINNYRVHSFVYNEFIDEELTIEQYNEIKQLVDNIEVLLGLDKSLEVDIMNNVYTISKQIYDNDGMFADVFDDVNNTLQATRDNIATVIKLLIGKVIKVVNPEFDFTANTWQPIDNVDPSGDSDKSTDSVSIEV